MVTSKERDAIRGRIADCCRKLILSQRMVELCQQEGTPKQEKFLVYVLEQEILRREQSKLARQLKRARQLNRACFPVLKSFDGYEFGSIRFPPALNRDELLSCRFITEKQNLILYGPVGIGNYRKCFFIERNRLVCA
jgi:DNA replication protein DnaC